MLSMPATPPPSSAFEYLGRSFSSAFTYFGGSRRAPLGLLLEEPQAPLPLLVQALHGALGLACREEGGRRRREEREEEGGSRSRRAEAFWRQLSLSHCLSLSAFCFFLLSPRDRMVVVVVLRSPSLSLFGIGHLQHGMQAPCRLSNAKSGARLLFQALPFLLVLQGLPFLVLWLWRPQAEHSTARFLGCSKRSFFQVSSQVCFMKLSISWSCVS